MLNIHGVGTGIGGQLPLSPPPSHIVPTKKIKKQRHINQCIAIRLRYVHSSVDVGNHRCTNVQNCIHLKYKCGRKMCAASARKFFDPPPPSPKRSYGLDIYL